MLAATASVFSLARGIYGRLAPLAAGDTARTALVFFIALPLTFSGLIVAYGFILSYGRAGFITQILALIGVDPATFSQPLYTRRRASPLRRPII